MLLAGDNLAGFLVTSPTTHKLSLSGADSWVGGFVYVLGPYVTFAILIMCLGMGLFGFIFFGQFSAIIFSWFLCPFFML